MGWHTKEIALFCTLFLVCLTYADKSYWCDNGTQEQKLRDSLDEFYSGTELTSWKNAVFWGSPECPCEWYGVDCIDSNTTVSLNLKDNGISGSVSETFCSNIYYAINLNNNNFFGELPSCIGDLKLLVSLRLANNSFQGLLPQTFEKLTNLENLDIHQNNFAGPYPNYIQCPGNYFAKGYDIKASQNKFWCPAPDWCNDSSCANCTVEPSSACTSKNAAACDSITHCCYKSSWDSECDDMVDKGDVTCTDTKLPEDCKVPEKGEKSSSPTDYSFIGWIFLAVFIVLIILGIGCFGVFYITLTKRNWSFKQVKSQLVKIDSETYMIDPDDDIYQDETPPRSSLDYEL